MCLTTISTMGAADRVKPASPGNVAVGVGFGPNAARRELLPQFQPQYYQDEKDIYCVSAKSRVPVGCLSKQCSSAPAGV